MAQIKSQPNGEVASMAKPVADFDWAEMDALRTVTLSHAEPVRGFTLAMYTKRYGLAKARARTEIARLLKRGAIERIGTQAFLREGSKGGVHAAVYDFVKTAGGKE